MRPHVRPVLLFALVFLITPLSGMAGQAEEDCPTQYVHAVGEACLLPNGLWQVTLANGHVRTTHGADPYVPDEGAGALAVRERQPACATDHYQHILYGRPASAPDRHGSVVDTIRQTIRRMNWILNEDSLASGGPTADYKVLCDASGLMRVDSFTVPSGSSDFNVIVNAARSAGFFYNHVDYTIFFDGTASGVCGVGHISYDERPYVYNANNFGGDYGVTYKDCWTGRTAQHENGHNQGAVQRTAPDSDLAGHCLEGQDIMCYPTSQFLVLCRDRVHFDCDHDTYFDSAPEPGEWLATHWNIGSSVNRFILFNGPAPNGSPEAAFTFTLDDKTLAVDASASTDPEGAPLTYSWSFGDGTNAAGVTATHTYSEGGRYRVHLQVLDGAGGDATVGKSISVGLDVPPSVERLTFQGVLECTVTFNGLETKDACGGGASDDHTFTVLAGVTGLRSIVVWDKDAATAGAETVRYTWHWPPGVGEGTGTSPLIATHDVAISYSQHLHGGDMIFAVRPTGNAGVVLQQPYIICIDVLYGYATAPADPSCSA